MVVKHAHKKKPSHAHKEKTVEHAKTEKSNDTITITKNQLVMGLAVVVIIAVVLIAMGTSGPGDAPIANNDTGDVADNVAPTGDSFEIVVLTAASCKAGACNPDGINSVTKELFPKATFKEVDVDSAEGKAMVTQYDLTYVPAFIFEEEVAKTDSWTKNPQLANSFEKSGSKYKLKDSAIGASYFINEEKRAAQEELAKQYPQANMAVLEATGEKPRFDYFVMSFCPYGNPADEAASLVYDALGDTVEIVPHYILSESNGVLNSLHGEQEGNQDVRELCSLEKFGYDAFFAFVLQTNKLCDSRNADTCWESAADAAGVDKAAIQSCFDERKVEIAQGQNELIQKLKTMRRGQLTTPSASPTLLVNGATYEGARDAESIKAVLCSKFDVKPAECDGVITTEVAAPVGSC